MDEREKRKKEQAPMLSAANNFLRDADTFLASAEGKPGSIRISVPYALYARMMQLGRAINFLAASGYAEEAKPLARAILSTAIAIKLITVDDLRATPPPTGQTVDFDKESDGRALAYLAHHYVIRRRQNQGYLQRGWVDKAKVDEIEKEVDAQDAATLVDYANHGITPSAKLGNRPDSWHGLSDEDAADRVGVGDCYALYYRPFSEELHGSEPAVRAELERVLTTGTVSLGPRFDDPYPVLRALVDAVGGALLSLDRQFGIGRAAEIHKVAEPLVAALSDPMPVGRSTWGGEVCPTC
jgi:hypothetical protein